MMDVLQDEWLDLQADALEWSPPAAGHAMHGGLPPGEQAAQGLGCCACASKHLRCSFQT